MTEKPITPDDIMGAALRVLSTKPSFMEKFRNMVPNGTGVDFKPGYRPMTQEEIKARDIASLQREQRNEALVDQAFAKLNQEEIDALEWYYSSEFY